MPLPDEDKAWPPKRLTPALKAIDEWDTWWAGDPQRLTTLYGGGGTYGMPDPKVSQYRGGMLGRISRWWWGTPPAPGELRSHTHIPIAGDICSASANLLFSEPPRISVVDSDTTQARLDSVCGDRFHATLLRAAELAAALGGVYLRPVADTTLADEPWLDVVHPDRAWPEFTWGRLSAVTFWRIVECEDGQVWRHLERHEPGAILHGLYQGTDDRLGHPVPLEEQEETAPLAAKVDSEGRILTAYPRLGVAYIPNQPTRKWRSLPLLSNLGRSDLDGVENLMDDLDQAHASWMRDLRLGAGRVVVPQSMLQSLGPGRGGYWNPAQEMYTGLDMLTKPGESPLTLVQFNIRVKEHQDTCDDLVKKIVRSAGYSEQTFGSDGEVAVTATEVNAKGQRSETTRGNKILAWRPGLGDVIQALLAMDADLYRSGADWRQRPLVEFQDGIQEDALTLANTAEVLERAKAASTATKVRMQHPDWDDARVAAEVAAIHAETGQAVPDPMQTGLVP
ncbi:phage portal protein [Kitasatospora sp. NPDC001132]